MSLSNRLQRPLIAGIAVIALWGGVMRSQTGVTDPAANNLPNPNPTVVRNWGPLPDSRTWGSSAGVEIGPDGNVWAYDRCGAVDLAVATCDGSNVPPILKFERTTGKVLASFGAGKFVLPHGLHVDREGNVWVTDSRANQAGTKGHVVLKFNPRGEVLLTLGRGGLPGDPASGYLSEPCDVITAPNGDIFVSEGHSGQNPNAGPDTVARISKFSKDGKFLKSWGRFGSGPGEFKTPHAMAFDSRGRLFVADRGNHRIQIFDQDGKYLDSFVQFSRVSGLFITPNDTLYAIDSESNPARHPNWKTGIRIGSVNEDRVTAFIPPHHSDEGPHGAAGEGVAVDPEGNVYAAEGPTSRKYAGGGLTKYGKQ
jgi:DNA-binding beta-propeller fold protein YncE